MVSEISLLPSEFGKVCCRADTDGPGTKLQNQSQSSSCSSREATRDFPEYILYCIDRVKYGADGELIKEKEFIHFK